MQNNSYNGNPKIKADGVQQTFTAHEVQEYIRCRDDVEYFCKNYVKVISLDHGLVPFELRGYQSNLVKHYSDNRFSIVLAPRQSGKSVTSVAWLLHYIIFNADKKVAVLANKGATAREMLSRFTLMLENLPFFLQPGVRVLNKGNIVFGHNSEIIAAATSSSSIRGISANIIFLDEFAFVHKAEEFYTSTYPVISSGSDTKVIITSTPNGVGNMFYKLWQGAISKSNEFKSFTIHWRDVPGRDDAWRAKTIANTSEAQFRQEFSCEFVGSADTLINSTCLLGLQAQSPININHDIVYYESPQEDHAYILIADVSKGRGQDYSTFSAIDISSRPFKQVCTYRNNTISPLLFPNLIVRAAMQYNQALVLVENNDVGQVVCNAIYYDHEYENMFTTSAVKSNGIGVVMSKKVKRIGCSNLKDLLEGNKLHIVDPYTIAEFANFVPKGDSFAAAEGSHDDSVMNFVLFSWFVSTDIFNGMSNTDLRELLYSEKMLEMEEDLPPFGYVSTGSSVINDSYNELINNAKEWHSL